MEEMYEGMPVFCYAYRPMKYCNGPDDGGFAVNLMDNGTVIYTRRNAQNKIIEEFAVQVPAQVVNNYYFLVSRSRRWLVELPLHMAEGTEPGFISMVGLNGYPDMFRMDDLPRLANCEFGSLRGHCARLMFNLLEDVAGMLRPYGVYLTLNSYTVDPNRATLIQRQRRHRLFG